MVATNPALYRFAVAGLLAACVTLASLSCEKGPLLPRLLSDCVDTGSTETDFRTSGMHGIKLTVDTRCVFQIDESSSSMLWWCPFVQRFPRAYVRMKVKIDESGRVASIFDKKDGGDPGALAEIHKAVSGWHWEGGCLVGDLYLEFNAAQSRLNYDDTRLVIAKGFEHCEIIRDKRLHMVQQSCNFGALRRSLDW